MANYVQDFLELVGYKYTATMEFDQSRDLYAAEGGLWCG